MSGVSGDGPCPNCKNNMDTYTDYKPFDNVSGECNECGFYYKTVSGQLELDEINYSRNECEDTPLTALPEIDTELIWL